MMIDFTRTMMVIFDSVKNTMISIGQENLKRSGLVQKFAPLTKHTIREKRFLGVRSIWINKPLLRFGDLYNGLYAKIQGSKIIFGSKVYYARYHLTGTKYMPQRDFTQFNEKWFELLFRPYTQKIAQTAAEDVLTELNRSVIK